MAMPTLSNAVQDAVRDVVYAAVKRMQEDLIQASVEEFERRLRATLGTCAINIADYFTVERTGHELVIHVKIEGGS